MPPDAEETLRRAARDALDEDYETALNRFDGQYESICAREHPDYRLADGRETACHLYEPRSDQTATVSSTADD
jgi:hypothetical protein